MSFIICKLFYNNSNAEFIELNKCYQDKFWNDTNCEYGQTEECQNQYDRMNRLSDPNEELIESEQIDEEQVYEEQVYEEPVEIEYDTLPLRITAKVAQIIFITCVGINLVFSYYISSEKKESNKEIW